MKTVDIHAHLLNPAVRFERWFDRLALRFFARSLGADVRELKADPWNAYVRTLARLVRESQQLKQSCLFAVDARLDRRGRELHRDGTVCAATEDVLRVARRFPELFIPFLSVNPLRPDALERLDAYHAAGCRGAKFLQNYWRLDLNDDKLIPYYEKLRALQLPLVVHVGSEFAVSSQRRYEGADMLRLPLDAGVTVIAAHMGLGQINHWLRPWRNLSKDPRSFNADYHQILHWLECEPNLYADLSAMLLPLRARALQHLATQTQVHHKLLFGTDYPVPFTVTFNTHGLARRESAEIAQITNPLDRYAQVLLAFFGAHSPVFSNYQKLLVDV